MKKCIECGGRSKQNRCNTCRSRRFRKNNPMKYAYYNLIANSKRRNISFTLTFQQFQQFSIRHEYIQNKGTTKESYSIDRINSRKGYSLDNIQVLTVSQNSSKGIKKMIEWNEYLGELRTRTLMPQPSYTPGADW